jgi:hypothetical protein
MKYFIAIIKQTIKSDTKNLGRWFIENCDKKKEQRIYLANSDYGCPNGFYNHREEKEDDKDIDTQIRVRYMV